MCAKSTSFRTYIHQANYDVKATSSNGANTPLTAHAGFLYGAKALAPKLQQQMAQYISDASHSIDNVIFTGHSAGAAVASLLFLHFLTNLRVARCKSCPSLATPSIYLSPFALRRNG